MLHYLSLPRNGAVYGVMSDTNTGVVLTEVSTAFQTLSCVYTFKVFKYI